MQLQTVSVPFYDDILVLINQSNEPMVAMKPIVSNMGLDWKTQHEKLHEKFNSVVGQIPTTGSDGKIYEMTCLPLRKLPAWLYSISPNKVKPELKDKITRYQEECDDVLWDYWSKGAASRGDKVLDIPTLPPRDPVRPIGIRNKIDGLSARDTLILSNLKNDLIQKIAQNSEPAIRASLYIDLRRVSDALGVAVIDADHLPFPKPLPVEPAPARPKQHASVTQFWNIINELDELGVLTNHSRSPDQIAINLPQVAKLAVQHKIALPYLSIVRKYISESQDPAFIKQATINSGLLNKSVKCYVFRARDTHANN